MTDAHVCTLLVGLKPSDVEQPLAQFQHTRAERDDIWQLVQTINRIVHKAGERSLAEGVLKEVFETYWPRLEKRLSEVADRTPMPSRPKRSDTDILQEILELMRNLERRLSMLEVSQPPVSTPSPDPSTGMPQADFLARLNLFSVGTASTPGKPDSSGLSLIRGSELCTIKRRTIYPLHEIRYVLRVFGIDEQDFFDARY